MDNKTYDILYPKIQKLIECASGDNPCWSGIKLNEGVMACVIPGKTKTAKDNKPNVWALKFVEADNNGIFSIGKMDNIDIRRECMISSDMDPSFAAEAFTRQILEKQKGKD